MMRTITATVTVALLALATPALAGQFYKWVDAQGTTHYDVKPPAAGVKSREVRTYNSASSDQPDELERLDNKRAAEKRADDQTRKQAEASKQARAEPEKTRTARCDQLRKNLNVLTNRPIVRVKNPDTGKMEVLDQTRRKKMLNDTRQSLKLCNNDP